MMSAGGMTPDYLLRDLQRFQVGLALSDDQTVIVEQILRDYDESFREASESIQESIRTSFSSMRGNEDDPSRQKSRELRERSREIREKLDSVKKLGDEDGMKELQTRLNRELESIRDEMNQARVEQWQSPERQTAFEEVALLMQDQLRLKRKMRQEFESDLVVILNDEQLVFWPPLMRQLTRDRLLPRGRLSGETIDVMGLVEQREYGDETLLALAPSLSDWDISVTQALEARNNHLVENQGSLMTSMRTMDPNSGIAVMKEQAGLAERVRDINDTAIANISIILGPDEGGSFNTFAKQKGYPKIYRMTRAERAYEAALGLEGLEPDILESILELEEAMKIELEFANETLYAETHRWEAQEQIDRMNRFAQRMIGNSSEQAVNPIRESEEIKMGIEDNYIEQLKLLLTAEQIEKLGGLKKREERNDRGNRDSADRGRRGGDRGGFEGGREQFMERFDKDGNGEISEEERQAIRDHFRNGGVHGGGGSDGGGRP
jgi:hypothetical protein